MKSTIYETSGRAKEYCELALNLYSGCTHGCKYCYVPTVMHQAPEEFHREAKPRLTIGEVAEGAARFFGEKRPVLLSFTCDPYQPAEEKHCLTHQSILVLKAHGLNFTVLTKGGEIARRDFGLYGPGDSFGVTLTFLHDGESRIWEPGAALPDERLANLAEAHARGIRTWVSLEPVIAPSQTLSLIEQTAAYVDHYKVGMLNYMAPPAPVDWKAFAESALKLLREKKKGFYVKMELARELGQYGGIAEGVQVP